MHLKTKSSVFHYYVDFFFTDWRKAGLVGLTKCFRESRFLCSTTRSKQYVMQSGLMGVRQAEENAVKQSGDHSRFRPTAVRFLSLSRQLTGRKTPNYLPTSLSRQNFQLTHNGLTHTSIKVRRRPQRKHTFAQIKSLLFVFSRPARTQLTKQSLKQ